MQGIVCQSIFTQFGQEKGPQIVINVKQYASVMFLLIKSWSMSVPIKTIFTDLTTVVRRHR